MRHNSSQVKLLPLLLAITLAVCVAAEDGDIFACYDQRTDSSNEKYCNSCYTGYNLENSKSCVANFQSVCNTNSGKTCTMNNCLYEVQQYMYQNYQGWAYYWVCSQCAYPYSVNQGACAYYCKYTGTYTSISNCKPICYVENCDLCTEQSSSICRTCSSNYLLQDGTCVSKCSDGYYKDGNNCLKCSPFCQTCTSLTTCGICTASNGLPTTCQCPSGTSLLKNECVSCPYQQRPNTQNICERMCTYPQYAILNSDGSLNQCQDITSSDNQYCLNNLYQLKTGVKATLTKPSNFFVIQFQIQQTPNACYQYSLFGVQQSFPLYSYSQNEDYLVSFYFYQSQVDSGEIECSFTDCKVFLRIYWGGQIQYIFAVKIDINLTAILSNTISYNGKYQVVSIVCEDCQIPSTQITPSALTTTCGAGQICSDNLIETPIGSIVTITQKVTNSTLVHNTLTPHSLKFDYVDQTTQQSGSFYLKNYTYTNDIQGQITYSFVASAISNGQMTITSIITNAVVGRMLETTTISSVTYPQLKIGMKSSNPISQNYDSSQNQSQEQSETESSSGTAILVTVVIILLIALSATSFYFYRKSKKQQSQLPIQNPEAQVNDSKIQKSIQLEIDQQVKKDVQESPIDSEVKIKYIEGVISHQNKQDNNTSGMEAKSKVAETDTLVQIPEPKEEDAEKGDQVEEEVINIEIKEEINHQQHSNKEIQSQSEVSNLPGIINLDFSDSESNSSQE